MQTNYTMLSLTTLPTIVDNPPGFLKSTASLSSKRMSKKNSLTSLLKPTSASIASNVRSFPLPILPAHDSLPLIQIRSQRKRRSENCPLDNLRSIVATKRQRLGTVSPRQVVRFHLEANQVYERKLSEEDLCAAWMSPIEQILVKKRLHEVIFMFRNGFLNPHVDSIRGIEFRAYSGLAVQKLTKAKQYRLTVLSHQHHTCLAQLSASLSAHASKQAIALALYDTEEARAALLS